MVKTTTNLSKTVGSSSSQTLKYKPDATKALLVEERPTKPGTTRFSRRRDDVPVDEQMPVFKDTLNVRDLCRDLLVGGYVQSYIDFYHLTHRLDPITPHDKHGSPIQIEVSLEDMIFIRDNLVKAEASRRQGDTAHVYESYIRLADYYVKNKDWKTSFFFHEKCLEVAQITGDIRVEMSANHALGTIYQLMADFDGARNFHEKHEQLATQADIFEEIANANVELYKVYLTVAERYEGQEEIDIALEIYQKCLEAAKKSWDRSAEGEANGRIGNLLLIHKKDAQASLPYLREQSQIASDLGYAEGRCRACSSLALALDSLGQAEKALNELKLVHKISEQAGDSYLQAQACKALGTLYSKVGKLEAAVEILQKHFNLLKSIMMKPDTERTATEDSKPQAITTQDIDLARAYIGISKGNLLMGSYVVSIESNLTALLDWKLARVDISPNSDAELLNDTHSTAEASQTETLN